MNIVNENIMIDTTMLDRPLVILTGATGGLGSECLEKLLNIFPGHFIVLFIRANSAEHLMSRLNTIFDYLKVQEDKRERVIPLLSDICQPDFGLDKHLYDSLVRNVTHFYHIAANVDFNLSFESSAAINVISTNNVLSFVSEAKQQNNEIKLNYVSTAYVVGDRKNKLKESELNCNQDFYNGYEKSKFVAECKVESLKQELPITIYRPSMIVGHSDSGRIKNYFAFYDFLKILGLVSSRVLLADPNVKVDIVPSDYVANAICYFSTQQSSQGKTYHLTAGLERSLTIGEVLDVVFSDCELPRSYRRPQVIPADYFWSNASEEEVRRFKNSAMSLLLKTYTPYLSHERDFEVSKTMEILSHQSIVLPSVRKFLPNVVHYAIKNKYQ